MKVKDRKAWKVGGDNALLAGFIVISFQINRKANGEKRS